MIIFSAHTHITQVYQVDINALEKEKVCKKMIKI